MLNALPRIDRSLQPVWQFAFTVPSSAIRAPIAHHRRFGSILKAASAHKVVEGDAVADHLHPNP